MKYQLLPLDPDLGPVDFDTQSILDLALLGPYDKDAGVVYFDGVACLEPRPTRPTGPTLAYVRELEAEAAAVKSERDALIATITEIAGRVDVSRIAIHEDEECYLLDWQDYVALRKIAAANEAQP